jgi:hypothetical protein
VANPYFLLGQLEQQAAKQVAEKTAKQKEESEKRLMKFEADLREQALQRSQAWELEKAEINSRYRLQEDLQTESLLRARTVTKQIEREENGEKFLKEFSKQYGPREGLDPDNQIWYDTVVSRAQAEIFGLPAAVVPVQQEPSAKAPHFLTESQNLELEMQGYSPQEMRELTNLPTPLSMQPKSMTGEELVQGGYASRLPNPNLPRPKNMEELRRLPKGTRYIDLDGNEETKK